MFTAVVRRPAPNQSQETFGPDYGGVGRPAPNPSGATEYG